MVEVTDLYCPICKGYHRAEVRLIGGWPQSRWIGPHREPTRAEAVEKVADAASHALDIALGPPNWHLVDEIIGQAVEVNDSLGQPPGARRLDDEESRP